VILPPVMLSRDGEFITCRTCGSVVWWNSDRFNGCDCDPDSPTWCGISPTGRVYSARHNNYQVFQEKKE